MLQFRGTKGKRPIRFGELRQRTAYLVAILDFYWRFDLRLGPTTGGKGAIWEMA